MLTAIVQNCFIFPGEIILDFVRTNQNIKLDDNGRPVFHSQERLWPRRKNSFLFYTVMPFTLHHDAVAMTFKGQIILIWKHIGQHCFRLHIKNRCLVLDVHCKYFLKSGRNFDACHQLIIFLCATQQITFLFVGSPCKVQQ